MILSSQRMATKSHARMLVTFLQTSNPSITFAMSNINITPKTTARLYDLYRDEGKHIKAMSIEELRASEHFEDRTEDELISIMDTVRSFSEIVYSAWSRQRQDAGQSPIIILLQNLQAKAA